MSARARRGAAFALACALACGLGGCASVSDDAQDRSLAALKTPEPQGPRSLPALEVTKACMDDPYTGLKPMRLPSPGHMPKGSTMRAIQRRGSLRVGVDQNSLGLGYYDPNTGRMEGFDIDVVRAVARAIFGGDDPDAHIRYRAISTQQREAAIFYGKVDIVASAYTNTCDRQRRMRFSSVYHRARTRLLVLRDSHVHSLTDLKGARVCTTATSTGAKLLEKTGVVAHRVELRSDCLLALQEREVAAISIDDAILVGLCRQDPETKIVGPRPKRFVQRYGLAMQRRHKDLVRFVNGVLAKLDLDRLRKYWLKALENRSGNEITDCEIPGT